MWTDGKTDRKTGTETEYN